MTKKCPKGSTRNRATKRCRKKCLATYRRNKKGKCVKTSKTCAKLNKELNRKTGRCRKSKKTKAKVYRLSSADYPLIIRELKQSNTAFNKNDESKALTYMKKFKTSQKNKAGNWGNYDMSKDGYDGVYGYVLDHLQGNKKYK